MDKLYDLKLMLDAIQATRTRWLDKIGSKMREWKEYNPKLTSKELFDRALFDKEVNEEFQNLITLYGVVGSDAAAYSQALSQDVGHNAQIIKLPKKAA